jgi:tRNA-2-methylthio-N6-dimethylallyladenosine synthase
VTVFAKKEFQVGDFVEVKITNCTSATLIGDALELSKRV